MMTDTPQERGAAVRVPPPMVFFGAAVLGLLIRRFGMTLPIGSSASLRVFGAAVIIAGIALVLAAARLFRKTGQDPAPWTPSPTMIAQGPYRFSRNPMYVGMTLTVIGVGFATNNLWTVILAPIALACVHFTAVLPEEKYLDARFGADYKNYRSAVRRYF